VAFGLPRQHEGHRQRRFLAAAAFRPTCTLEERKGFIEDWLAGGGDNVAALCRLQEITRKTGYKWLERFREAGRAALEDRSHAAPQQPRRMPGSEGAA
jgi:transposase